MERSIFEDHNEYDQPPIETGLQLSCADLIDELLLQAEYHSKDKKGDKYIAAFNLALLEAFKEIPDINNLIQAYINLRTDITKPSHAVNLPLRAIQKQIMESSLAAESYPNGFNSVNQWTGVIQAISSDQERLAELASDLFNRQVQSNKSERYTSIKAIVKMFSNDLGDQPRILDIGCSRNHGLKKLSLNLDFEPVASQISDDNVALKPYEQSFCDTLNQAISSDIVLGPSTGSDIVPLDKSDVWAKACSFYPGELISRAGDVIEYDILDTIEAPAVNFIQADFINRDLAHLPGYKSSFDIVTLSTVMYQLTELERIDMLSNALWHVKEGGLIVVQDFAALDTTNPKKLVFRDHWFDTDYPYRTFVLEANHNRQLSGFKEYFRWQTSRCHDALIMPDAADKLAKFL